MDSINYLLSIETRGIKLGIERTQYMMKACGNPHLGLPVIQVAGTNGKGSVCSILASILKAADYKTGLYTSPHLVRLNERIRIDGQSIPDVEIDNFLQLYKQNIEEIKATFFETLTAITKMVPSEIPIWLHGGQIYNNVSGPRPSETFGAGGAAEQFRQVRRAPSAQFF